MTTRKTKKRLGFFAVILILCALGGYEVLGPNTNERLRGSEYLYIHTGSNYEDVKKALHDGYFIRDMWSFDMFAKRAGLPAHIHPGKYRITKGMSNFSIVRMLRGGHQTPVKITFHKLRRKEDFIRFIGKNLEADSNQLRRLMSDSAYLAPYGLDSNTSFCAIMPDSYEFYWNTGADSAFRKIARKYAKYWTDKRKKAAESQGLTPAQAVILASIVDDETNVPSDKPLIASVYLNRLHTGMRLQADPTVKFAVGDPTIRRIGGDMLNNPSPYNTYKYTGLPPGPICTPATSSIDAVINAPKTGYKYFCAMETFNGRSRFACTYEEQKVNAARYQKALDARGIH